MKKIITLICSLALLSSTLVAKNFFDQRYFEIMVGAPVNVSNNSFALEDVLKKELVIDFTKIANEMPENGFNVIAETNPVLGFNLNLPKFSLGFNVGAEVYGRAGIGKGLFDLLGNGYNYNEDLTVDLDADVEAFITTGIKTSFKVNDFKIEINPSWFLPIVHVTPDSAKVVLSNSENGDIAMHMDAKMNVFSLLNLSEIAAGNIPNISSEELSSMGFDLQGAVHFLYFDNLDLWGSLRVPIIPGHLKYVASYGVKGDYEGNVQDFLAAASGSGASGDSSGEPNEIFTYDDPSAISFVEVQNKYWINRPLKLNLYANYKLIPDFIEFTGGIGLGVRNPFAANMVEVKVYPEYYLESKVGLANVIVLSASTQYTDQVFKHQLALKFNLRLVEVDAGASLQSSDLKNSFRITGLGAFVNCYIGF